MKKIFNVLALVAVALGFIACGGPDKKAALEINVTNLTYNTATVTVSCKDAEKMFYFDIISKDVLEEYTLNEFVAEYVEEIRAEYDEYTEEYASQLGINSWAELVAEYASKGTDSYDYTNLTPETTYIVWAFEMDADFNVVGDIVTKEFRTTEVQKVAFNVAVAENDTAFFFTPSDEKIGYLATCIPTDTLRTYGYTSTSEYFQEFVEYTAQTVNVYSAFGIGWEYFLYYGEIYIPKSELKAGQENHFLAAAMVDGVMNSDLVDLTFNGSKKAPARVSAAPANRIEVKNFTPKRSLVKRQLLKK